MEIYALKKYVIGEKYTLDKQSSVIITNTNTDTLMKVVSSDTIAIYDGDIIMYKKGRESECVLNGKTYIVVHLDDIVARIVEEDE